MRARASRPGRLGRLGRLGVLAWVLALTFAPASLAGAAEGDPGPSAQLPRVADFAGLVSAGHVDALEDELRRVGGEHGADVVIVTQDLVAENAMTAFADNYFDYGPDPADPSQPGWDPDAGYGVGPDRSGILLLVSLDNGQWWVSTRGESIRVFTDQGIDWMMDEVAPKMTDGDWDGAFDEFAAQADRYYEQAENGEPFDVGNRATPLMSASVIVLLSVLAGSAVGGGAAFLWVRQLRSVRPAADALGYVDARATVLTTKTDTLVSTSTHFVPAASSSSSGGGSSIHSSSSGASHGGGGGHF